MCLFIYLYVNVCVFVLFPDHFQKILNEPHNHILHIAHAKQYTENVYPQK